MITDPGSISDERCFAGFPYRGEGGLMKKRNTDAQIAFAMRQVLSGTPGADIVRKMRVSNHDRQG
jgi:hypothetical protein